MDWTGQHGQCHATAKNIYAYLQSQHGSSLFFYNRTASRGDGPEALGGERCASVSELATRCDVIFISASDDAAVESIIKQIILSGLLSNKIIIDTTTIYPNTTKKILEKLGV